ncbi:MAG TPA: hypothetical protein VFN09_02595 [Rhodanobacteraceae bacterium]|nr:hypothetical protein [Rhodanobacteraceae bacterium]
MSLQWRFFVLIPLSILGFVLLFVLPDIQLGRSGSVAVLAGSWLAWYLLWSSWQKSLADTTDTGRAAPGPGEQHAWIGALFSAIILLYFALHGSAMVDTDGGMSRDAARIGTHIVLLIVVWQVVMAMLRRHWHDRVDVDERDRAIQTRAATLGHGLLIALSIGLAATLALTPLELLGWARPMALSNLIIAGLIASCLLEYLVAAGSYWRDRHPTT